jgi:hypothetical protein
MSSALNLTGKTMRALDSFIPMLLSMSVGRAAVPQAPVEAAVSFLVYLFLSIQVSHFDGRAYEIVDDLLTFDAARARASTYTYKGAAGHLVSIRTAAEQAFVTGAFTVPHVCLLTSPGLNVQGWIGATDSVAEGWSLC